MATFPVNSSANLSTLNYLAGDDIAIQPGVTLTISATPTTPIRSISANIAGGVCNIVNTSTSTLLKLSFSANNASGGIRALNFESDGELNITGDWITLYTGDGTANQTVCKIGRAHV